VYDFSAFSSRLISPVWQKLDDQEQKRGIESQANEDIGSGNE